MKMRFMKLMTPMLFFLICVPVEIHALSLPQISAGEYHTAGLNIYGRVVAVGTNAWRQYNVTEWENICQIAVGTSHTVGLKSDGSVVVVGGNGYGQAAVSSWQGIQCVAAGADFTVGVNSDGSLASSGTNAYGQLNVSSWKEMKAVAAGNCHTVGLKSDGTVLAVGKNSFRQLNVGTWCDIVQVAAGDDVTLGLKADGTVLAVGRNDYGQADVTRWTDIRQVATGGTVSLGLKADGTVVMAGRNLYAENNVASWTDILQVDVGADHSVGLKTDGSVVAAGRNSHRQTDVASWSLGAPEDTASMHLTRTQVSELYVSIFGRASEGEGNAYWMAAGDDLVATARAMLATPAAADYFGTTLDSHPLFVEFIYENTLGKILTEDPDGIAYWVAELDGGKSKAEVVVALIEAVKDPLYLGSLAQQQFINKVTVSDYAAVTITGAITSGEIPLFVQCIDMVTHEMDTVFHAKGEVTAISEARN